MKILALEFSSSTRSAAVLCDATEQGAARGPAAAITEITESGTRETKAFSMIEEALRQANCDRGQIECVAVGRGPGSYTGIRIAIAITQGWQLATPIKTAGISSVECIAAQAWENGLRGRAHVVLDAQRNEIYWAAYELNDSGRSILEPLRISTLEQARKRIAATDLIFGPEVSRWFSSGITVFPSAAMVAKLVQQNPRFTPAEALEPIYLRETAFVKAASGSSRQS
ncbi:MAG TPA: tRNA (adenosine(37)-N6)-threonylcarbamoyltransferase complex dimerization subunit type 1 TsaB [Verrucomicrobiae bacterium]|nr:tRNA (adenosine(37)-N6)-threonylcarbamoyltransferase complex dimerization subunit type 1 TsaB [Verrucomicrobiae bacterium]